MSLADMGLRDLAGREFDVWPPSKVSGNRSG